MLRIMKDQRFCKYFERNFVRTVRLTVLPEALTAHRCKCEVLETLETAHAYPQLKSCLC